MSDDLWPLAIGVAAGALLTYGVHKASVAGKLDFGEFDWNVGLGDSAKSYVAFGHDEARSGYNTSEVWDIRDRTYFSDNILYNKLPFIQLKATTDWDPNRLDFAGAYGPPDMDSPRPRLEHFLDLENRAF